jgi:hypothetical protein
VITKDGDDCGGTVGGDGDARARPFNDNAVDDDADDDKDNDGDETGAEKEEEEEDRSTRI